MVECEQHFLVGQNRMHKVAMLLGLTFFDIKIFQCLICEQDFNFESLIWFLADDRGNYRVVSPPTELHFERFARTHTEAMEQSNKYRNKY